ncbi:hypothetical protein [Treponema sp.]|uniref:hypothetical protein n=1 Tax=Treponema sp. TaxID=166 RepID=UPI00298D788F|nr:hypothetical protein [Treponema sp.]MCR5612873.1 hypothetical protein [Treponema sp.]
MRKIKFIGILSVLFFSFGTLCAQEKEDKKFDTIIIPITNIYFDKPDYFITDLGAQLYFCPIGIYAQFGTELSHYQKDFRLSGGLAATVMGIVDLTGGIGVQFSTDNRPQLFTEIAIRGVCVILKMTWTFPHETPFVSGNFKYYVGFSPTFLIMLFSGY